MVVSPTWQKKSDTDILQRWAKAVQSPAVSTIQAQKYQEFDARDKERGSKESGNSANFYTVADFNIYCPLLASKVGSSAGGRSLELIFLSSLGSFF